MKSSMSFPFLCLAVIATTSAADADPYAAVLIEGGTFRMGTDVEEIAGLKPKYGVEFRGIYDNETPGHQVTVSNFRLDRHEVTNSRFAEFIDEHAEWQRSNIPTHLHNGDYLADWDNGTVPQDKEDYPVAYVTWHAAQAFCVWAGGRLPTEAEWEYAARAGSEIEFPWGDQLPSPERANYYASGLDGRTKVGSYSPNGFGLYDLAGNVWELLLDSWIDQYPSEAATDPVAGEPVTSHQLLSVSGRRALRGASYGGSIVNLRTRWRDSHVVTNAVDFVGFRCSYPAKP